MFTRSSKKHKIPYVSNQVEFSLIRCDPWTNGLIEKCHKLRVSENRNLSAGCLDPINITSYY
jgi:hypothetical protein